MRKFSFLALSTFILGATFAQQQQDNSTTFQAGEDNYRFKTRVTAGNKKKVFFYLFTETNK